MPVFSGHDYGRSANASISACDLFHLFHLSPLKKKKKWRPIWRKRTLNEIVNQFYAFF